MLRETATVVLARVGERRATFTRANLLAEAFRQVQGVRFATPADRVAIAERVATLAVDQAVRLSPPGPRLEPDQLRRPDGTSRLRPVNSARYATAEVVAAEDHLLAAGQDLTGPRVDPALVDALRGWTPPNARHPLTAEQADAVAAVITSGRSLDVLVGAAGTGKSTTMAAVVAAWESAHGSGSVTGLAPSAAAADVLADAVGIPTENTAKWISENRRSGDRGHALDSYEARLRWAYPSVETRALQQAYRAALEEHNRWVLGPGRLVIVDEASLAGTIDLDHITGHARAVGAKVLLVGDPAQLSPVAAGGAFRLLVDARGAEVPSLTEVHRFTHAWEAEASLELRAGHTRVAKTYVEHGRVDSGRRDEVLDRLFAGWLADHQAGKVSLMVAGDAANVADLNSRARTRRVAAGDVEPHGVTTRDGERIGVGDVIVTRLNRRSLAAGAGWVKNGDDWHVTAAATDGSLTVTRPDGTGRTLLPADYVRDHVELGYATTAHRAQGRTVDTAHAYVSTATTRETLYVMATRGRDTNRLYVDTAPDTCDSDIEAAPDHALDAGDVLRHAISTSAADLSAHHTENAEYESAATRWRLDAEAAARRRARELEPTVGPHLL
jgi:ATP-dependent exoDNAse (exonuclease V) alpha subunit